MKIVVRTHGEPRLEATGFPTGCERSCVGALRFPIGTAVTITDDECAHLLASGVRLAVHDEPISPPPPVLPVPEAPTWLPKSFKSKKAPGGPAGVSE